LPKRLCSGFEHQSQSEFFGFRKKKRDSRTPKIKIPKNGKAGDKVKVLANLAARRQKEWEKERKSKGLGVARRKTLGREPAD